MRKVIVLSQTTLHPRYSLVDAASRVTWGLYKHPRVKIIHYYGAVDGGNISFAFDCRPPEGGSCLDNYGRLVQGFSDNVIINNYTTDTRRERFIQALEHCMNNEDFDFVYRTGCTSYIDIKKLVRYVDTVPDNKVYHGPSYYVSNFPYWDGIPEDWKTSFVASFHLLMSKDVVGFILDNKKEYLNQKIPEDIGLGKILTESYIKMENQREHMGYLSDVETWVEYRHNIEDNPATYSNKPYVFNYKIGETETHVKTYIDLHNQVQSKQ